MENKLVNLFKNHKGDLDLGIIDDCYYTAYSYEDHIFIIVDGADDIYFGNFPKEDQTKIYNKCIELLTLN